MHRIKRDMWKAGITIAGILLLLLLMAWIPMLVAGAYEGTSRLAATVTGTTTPTVDTTVTALSKQQLTLQVKQLQNQLQNQKNWLEDNSTALIAGFVTIVVALFGIYQWAGNRRDERRKEIVVQDNELEDRKAEREKQAEERFQKVVEGLGSERIEAKVGAAITLRSFLQPGYEQFYRQAFDLAVAHLRLRKAEASAPEPPSSSDQVLTLSTTAIPLDSLSQALITVFKEAFPLARNELKKELKKTNVQFDPLLLAATDVQLDYAYLARTNLTQAWLVGASLRKANLAGAHLEWAELIGAHLEWALLDGAQLEGANFSRAHLEGAHLNNAQLEEAHLNNAQLEGAELIGAQLEGAYLIGAQLEGVRLNGAQLEGADFSMAQLKGAVLTEANPEEADSLLKTKMYGVTGLTPEQREICIKKGATFDEV